MDTTEKAEAFLSAFLAKAPLMQIATIEGNEPWIATVWFAADEKKNIYFLSKEHRVHSQHLEKNRKVACAISGQFSQGPGEKIQGVQLSGTASKVTLIEMLKAYQTYSHKWPQVLKIGTLEAFKGNAAGTRLYKFVPEKIVWFDEINFPGEPRIQILPTHKE